jgi:uncharacterized protein YegJ (DUF2314 family)
MVIQESDDNLLLSCEAHGKETYFNIKKMEKRNLRCGCYVYVWFKRKKQAEKMWVKILKGTQKEGLGKLDNIPAFLDHLELGQTIKFKTDKEGITWQKK